MYKSISLKWCCFLPFTLSIGSFKVIYRLIIVNERVTWQYNSKRSSYLIARMHLNHCDWGQYCVTYRNSPKKLHLPYAWHGACVSVCPRLRLHQSCCFETSKSSSGWPTNLSVMGILRSEWFHINSARNCSNACVSTHSTIVRWSSLALD